MTNRAQLFYSKNRSIFQKYKSKQSTRNSVVGFMRPNKFLSLNKYLLTKNSMSNNDLILGNSAVTKTEQSLFLKFVFYWERKIRDN